MNKFDNIINGYKNVLEATGSSVIGKAVDDLETALKSSGTLSSNTNAKELATKLFDIPNSQNPMDNSLKNIFDKIRENPNNPNITDEERTLILSIIDKEKAQKPEQKEEEKEETATTPTYSKQNTTAPSQPNAKQYNPLSQPTQ